MDARFSFRARRSWAWIIFFLISGMIGRARLAAEAVKAPEFCSPTDPSATDQSAKSPVSLKTQPESTLRMAALLHEIARTDDPYQNPFKFPEMVDVLREKLRHTISKDELPALQLQYANTLLRAGNSAEALQEFERYEEMMKADHTELPAQVFTMVLTFKAMCHLRLGEEENCLYNHNADSCLMPIRGGGIHLRQRGSRGAIDVLTQLLQRYPGDLRARWLLNIAYMTLGEYPDKVPPDWLIGPKVFESDYPLQRFPDVAANLGLDLDDVAGGVVMDDFDNDGFLDLMVSAWDPSRQLRFFHNDGNGAFTERTEEAGLLGETGALNIIQGDYNNDGLIDVLMLRGAWQGKAGHHPNSLLRNNGDGTFTDVTVEAGILSFHPTQTAVWFDFNGDGWLDLYIGNESVEGEVHACELFRNNGNGTFTECAEKNGVAIVGYVKGVISGDFNNDGRPDLYLSRLDGSNQLFRNDGPVGDDPSPSAPWRFTDVAEAAGVTEPFESFSCWFWDYNNDGWLDLLVTGYGSQDVGDTAADYLGLPHAGQRLRLYRNRGDGTFADETKKTGLFKLVHTMGSNFGDLDNDGWLDFYLGTGNPEFTMLIPSRMFRSNEGKKFQDVTTSGGFGQLQKGHGVAFGDIDNDGDQDIYSVVGGAVSADHYHNQLFANPGQGNHSIKLILEGVKSNRVAIGARIKVVVSTPEGEREIFRVVGSGSSFGSSPLRQEIGLGQATAIVRAEISWPATGLLQVIPGLAMDRCYKIQEGAPTPAEIKLASFQLGTSPHPVAHPHLHPAAQRSGGGPVTRTTKNN